MTDATDGFEGLCTLVGGWTVLNGTTRVEFRMSAHGTVLVETWTWPEKNIEALTLYHLDRDALIATHYCPVGNQPRLAFTPRDGTGRLSFEFVSATNLPDPDVDHCQSFWFLLAGGDRFTRSETYENDGVRLTTEQVFLRDGHNLGPSGAHEIS